MNPYTPEPPIDDEDSLLGTLRRIETKLDIVRKTQDALLYAVFLVLLLGVIYIGTL